VADNNVGAASGQHTAGANEQVVYVMAMALTNSRWVPKGLYERAVKALGHVGITDVITLMGCYTGVSSRSRWQTARFSPQPKQPSW
jgi:hypothetical protein